MKQELTETIQIVKRTNGKYYAEIVKNIEDVWNENEEYECWIDEPSKGIFNLMTEENPNQEQYDAISETFCSYIKENGVKYARECTKCKCGMNEGFIVGGGDEYFCTTKCLYQDYTPKEWKEMYAKGFSDQNYWTEWESEEDFDFSLFDNKLILI